MPYLLIVRMIRFLLPLAQLCHLAAQVESVVIHRDFQLALCLDGGFRLQPFFLFFHKADEGENVKISVNYNGKTFGGTLSLDKTTEGNDIQYGLTINKENQQTALAISSKTITGWTPVDKGNQDLAEKEAENVLEIGDFLLNDGSVVDKAYDLSKITAAGKTIVGVVYYVGNPQPSALYNGTYTETQDILKAEAPNATHGLAIAINNGNDGNVARMCASVKYDYSTWFTDNETSNSYIKTTISITSAGTQFLGYNNTAVIEKVGDNTDETNTEGVKTGSSGGEAGSYHC